MNICATKTFNVKRFYDLTEEYNKIVYKIDEANKKLNTMKQVNLENMLLSLKQHHGMK